MVQERRHRTSRTEQSQFLGQGQENAAPSPWSADPEGDCRGQAGAEDPKQARRDRRRQRRGNRCRCSRDLVDRLLSDLDLLLHDHLRLHPLNPTPIPSPRAMPSRASLTSEASPGSLALRLAFHIRVQSDVDLADLLVARGWKSLRTCANRRSTGPLTPIRRLDLPLFTPPPVGPKASRRWSWEEPEKPRSSVVQVPCGPL